MKTDKVKTIFIALVYNPTSILTAAKEVQADIIILGWHSRKWLENIVIGSITENVLRNSSIPLFIVPAKERK